MKKSIQLLILSIFICLLWTVFSNAQLYQWIDKNGVKHFSNTPPSEEYFENAKQTEEIKFNEKYYQEQLIILERAINHARQIQTQEKQKNDIEHSELNEDVQGKLLRDKKRLVANDLCQKCKGYNGPGGPCYAGPGGPAYAGPGGPCYAGPGGSQYSGPDGSMYDGPDGPAYTGPGGPCYAGPGGPCYSGPGGTGIACPAICKKNNIKINRR